MKEIQLPQANSEAQANSATHAKSSPKSSPESSHPASYKYLLALAALGVVYGDIGTSPLYALKEAFHPAHHIVAGPANILGLLSLIFWSLMLVISLKYMVFILRADNKGEGGILALTSLIVSQADRRQNQLSKAKNSKAKNYLILLGLFGAAILYGDGMITPAISILSAVEGLGLITPIFKPYIIPITIGILIGLFSLQKKGTGTVGKIFGPITLTWFVVLAALGLINIIQTPEVLKAINPVYIISFFQNNAWQAFVVLGSVFLVVTGGEALYSDLGHFGRTPIKQAWFYVALPSLVLNYFGQGALLIRNPAAIENPFFMMAPLWALYPLVILAMVATTIASQALISGIFSITMQAVQSRYAPRLQISHTSKEEFGQIYIKNINRLLMLGSIALVITFKTSSNLAAAYGLAAATTMVISTILFYVVAREKWNWSRLSAGSLCGLFIIIDLAFWGASLLKIIDGGWFSVVVGITGFTIMTTWRTGKKLLDGHLHEKIIPLADFLEKIKTQTLQLNLHRIDGAAIYLNRSLSDAPYALIHTYEHFKSVHRHLIFLTVLAEETPKVDFSERVRVEKLDAESYRVILRYGYLEQPDIPRDIEGLILGKLSLASKKATFIIGKENLFATDYPGMAIWREKIFSILAKNELSAAEYFQLPKDRVLEIGVQIAL